MTWTATRLKYLSAVPLQNGLGEAGTHTDTSWPRYVRTTDIAGPRHLRDDVFASLPPSIASKAMLQRGDVLATAAGATIGKSTTYTNDSPACYAGFLVRFRPSSDVDGRFIAYWMQSAPYWQQIDQGAVRSTIDNFSAAKYRNLRLLLPSLEEQRRIADFLDDQVTLLDRAIELRRRHVELVHMRRDSYAARAVTGVDDHPPVDGPLPWGPVASDWPVVKLTFVARLGSGHTPSRSRPEWWVDRVVPWITTGEVRHIRDDYTEVLTETRESLSHLGIQNSAAEIHPQGTVVLSRTASAGFSAVMGAAMATSQDYATWTCGPRLDPFFLLWCLRAMRPDLLGRLAMGSTHKTIYMPDLQSLRIPLPPLDLQRQIVASVRQHNADAMVATQILGRHGDLLAERKQALITAAVTGKIDVSTAGKVAR